MALVPKVPSSIPIHDIPFVEEETHETDVETKGEDDDDEGESEEEVEMKEEEIGRDGGEREERRNVYIPP